MKLLLSLFALALFACNSSDSNNENEEIIPSSSSVELMSSSLYVQSSSSSLLLNSQYNGMWLSVNYKNLVVIDALNKTITGVDFIVGGTTDSIIGSCSLFSPDSFVVTKNSCRRAKPFTGENVDFTCNNTLINDYMDYKLELVNDTLIIVGGIYTTKLLKVTDYKNIESFTSGLTTDSIVNDWTFTGLNQNRGDLIFNADGTYSSHLYKDKKGGFEINSIVAVQGATVWRATGRWTIENYGINTSETECNLYEFDEVSGKEKIIGDCSEVPFMDFNGKVGMKRFFGMLNIFTNGYVNEVG